MHDGSTKRRNGIYGGNFSAIQYHFLWHATTGEKNEESKSFLRRGVKIKISFVKLKIFLLFF